MRPQPLMVRGGAKEGRDAETARPPRTIGPTCASRWPRKEIGVEKRTRILRPTAALSFFVCTAGKVKRSNSPTGRLEGALSPVSRAKTRRPLRLARGPNRGAQRTRGAHHPSTWEFRSLEQVAVARPKSSVPGGEPPDINRRRAAPVAAFCSSIQESCGATCCVHLGYRGRATEWPGMATLAVHSTRWKCAARALPADRGRVPSCARPTLQFKDLARWKA
jgi:hypothetical protein